MLRQQLPLPWLCELIIILEREGVHLLTLSWHLQLYAIACIIIIAEDSMAEVYACALCTEVYCCCLNHQCINVW